MAKKQPVNCDPFKVNVENYGTVHMELHRRLLSSTSPIVFEQDSLPSLVFPAMMKLGTFTVAREDYRQHKGALTYKSDGGAYQCIKSRGHQWQCSCKKGHWVSDLKGGSKLQKKKKKKKKKNRAILTHFRNFLCDLHFFFEMWWFRLKFWSRSKNSGHCRVIGCKVVKKRGIRWQTDIENGSIDRRMKYTGRWECSPPQQLL